jgi:hypothetical protein
MSSTSVNIPGFQSDCPACRVAGYELFCNDCLHQAEEAINGAVKRRSCEKHRKACAEHQPQQTEPMPRTSVPEWESTAICGLYPFFDALMLHHREGSPTAPAEAKQKLAEAFRRRLTGEEKFTGEYDLDEFIAAHGLSTAAAIPVLLKTVAQLFAQSVPPAMLRKKRWLGWKAEWDESTQKMRKKPHSPTTGKPLGPTQKNKEHFTTFTEAVLGSLKQDLDGVGYVFFEGGRFLRDRF